MFSPYPAQCNYLAKTTVLAFPHSSLPQCFTLPTVPTNPTGILGWDCWVPSKNAASHEKIHCLDGPRTTRESSFPSPKSSFSLNCCFLLQAEGPWDYKTFKSFFSCPATRISSFWGEVVLYKEVEFLVLKFLFWVTELEKCNFKVDMWTLSKSLDEINCPVSFYQQYYSNKGVYNLKALAFFNPYYIKDKLLIPARPWAVFISPREHVDLKVFIFPIKQLVLKLKLCCYSFSHSCAHVSPSEH